MSKALFLAMAAVNNVVLGDSSLPDETIIALRVRLITGQNEVALGHPRMKA